MAQDILRGEYANVTFLYGLTQLDASKLRNSLMFIGAAGARLYEEGNIGSIQVINHPESSESPKLQFKQASTEGLSEEETEDIYQQMEIPMYEEIPVQTPEEISKQAQQPADESFVSNAEMIQDEGIEIDDTLLEEISQLIEVGYLEDTEETPSEEELMVGLLTGDEWNTAEVDGKQCSCTMKLDLSREPYTADIDIVTDYEGEGQLNININVTKAD